VDITFVHFPSGRVEHLDSAKGGFDVFREPNSDLVRRGVHRAAHTRFRVFEKSVRFEARYTSQHNQKQN
jgi:hypothetical protein